MTILFSIAAYDYLAAELAPLAGAERGRLERSRFPDGERYLRVLDDVNDHDVIVVGGTISDEATLEIDDAASALVEEGAGTMRLVVPWYGYATMERTTKHGEAVTAKTRARLFSSIPPAKLGNQILMLDLHSVGIPYYFERPMHPVHVLAKPLIDQLAHELGGPRFIPGSPDAARPNALGSLSSHHCVP